MLVARNEGEMNLLRRRQRLSSFVLRNAVQMIFDLRTPPTPARSVALAYMQGHVRPTAHSDRGKRGAAAERKRAARRARAASQRSVESNLMQLIHSLA
jgi:hypothetical protein